MNLHDIADPDDPRIAGYRDIRERDLVGRQGLFVAEGKVVLRCLLSSDGYQAQSVLALKRRLPGLAPELAGRPDLPVYAVDDAVMERIAGFHVHRGVLALGRRVAAPTTAELIAALPARALVAVCVGISNHDNIGAIFRNAAAFGAAAVLLDETCCDPLYRKALRVSVGGVLKVPYARFGDALALSDALSARGFAQMALSPAAAADIRAVPRAPRMAIYLGAEGPGLPEAVLAKIPAVSIPIVSGFDSLNVAAASAIALFSLSSS